MIEKLLQIDYTRIDKDFLDNNLINFYKDDLLLEDVDHLLRKIESRK